jgi:predicted neuraminidase
VAVFSSLLPRGRGTWSSPERIADTPDHSEGNPVLWASPDGSLWLFYVTMYGHSWNDCRIKYKISEDHGRSWGPEIILRDELGWMTRNPPLMLNEKEVLLPVYNEVNWHSMVIISSDDFKTWRAYGDLDSPGGAIQPSVIRRDDGSLLMYMRTDADRIYWSESRDEGRTWSPAQPTNLRNPNAAVCLLKLRSGRLLLAFNDSTSGRTPLNLALSADDGDSWRRGRALEDEAGGSFSYPSLLQASEDTVHVAYSYNRDTIMHVATNESWVMGGL